MSTKEEKSVAHEGFDHLSCLYGLPKWSFDEEQFLRNRPPDQWS